MGTPKHRLRTGMTVVLTILLGFAMSLTRMNAQAAENPRPTKPSASATPTHTSVVPLTSADSQVLDHIRTVQSSKGCNLSLEATTTNAIGTCKVLIIGDSLGNNLSIGVKSELKGLKGVTVVSKSKSSTGLSNSWFYNWPTQFSKFLKQEKPNLVLVMLGANDHQNMQVKGKVLRFGTPAWTAKYSSFMKQITTMATQSGAYVAWVGLPVMRPPAYAAGMETLNGIYESVATNEPGVVFVKTRDYFATSSGKFTAWAKVNGKKAKIRGDDGIHFASAGQPVLGTLVISELAKKFHVKLPAASPKRITG